MIHNNKRINTLSINLSNLSKMLACPAAVEPRLSRGKTKRSPLAGSSGHRYLSSWKAYVCCWIGCTIDFDDDDTLCQLFFNSAWQFSGLRTVLNPWTMDVTTINCRGDSCFSAVGERESSELPYGQMDLRVASLAPKKKLHTYHQVVRGPKETTVRRFVWSSVKETTCSQTEYGVLTSHTTRSIDWNGVEMYALSHKNNAPPHLDIGVIELIWLFEFIISHRFSN